MKKTKALSVVKEAKLSPKNSQGISIENLLQQAIDKKVPVETVERIMAMRSQLKAEWAKEQFTLAMSLFQSECPVIKKTKEVKTKLKVIAYKYAPIESIITQVKPIIEKHGFSYTSNMDIIENGTTKIKATIKITHKFGHSEETSMTVPLGNKTDIMSNTQVVAAAQTFAKRYAFCNAFGILTGDEDNEEALKASDPKKVEGKPETLPQGIIDTINGCKTYDVLLKVCKEMRDANPHLYQLLNAEYKRRKDEIAEILADEVIKGIEQEEHE